MAIRRDRRCPNCKTVHAGGQIRPVAFGPAWKSDGRTLRKCPTCGYEGPTWAFTLVDAVKK